jgi:hypothetical protein
LTRVGNAEQVLLLLREQLERASRGRGTERSNKVERPLAATTTPLERARALAALDELAEEEVRRVVVRGLLVEAFGDAMSNDPAFQAVIDDVLRIITDMPGGPELIDRAVTQLRES